MSKSWREVWCKRTLPEHISNPDLIDLLRLNGWDSGAGVINVDEWTPYVRKLADRLEISDGHSVFEIGCGAGALLYSLDQYRRIRIGGVDQAEQLIRVARSVLPNADLRTGDAGMLPPQPQYDILIAHSLFQYLSMEAAKSLLEKMIRKSRFSVAILDIPDQAYRDDAEALRRGTMEQGVYEEMYDGLHHNYYSRDWFRTCFEENELEIKFLDTELAPHAQNRFRFGVIGQSGT